MKFNFKIQDYQTDDVNSVVNVFTGQKYSDGLSYRRDIRNIKDNNYAQVQLNFVEDSSGADMEGAE